MSHGGGGFREMAPSIKFGKAPSKNLRLNETFNDKIYFIGLPSLPRAVRGLLMVRQNP